jgi:hypothetical protein
MAEPSSTGNTLADSGIKIIRRASATLSVDNVRHAMQLFEHQVIAWGGYVEASNVTSTDRTRGTATYRIPEDKFSGLDMFIDGLGEVTHLNTTAQDVTDQYADTEGWLRAKRIEQTRLEEMLGRTNDVNTLLQVERQLGQVRAEIERHESRIRSWDRQVSFSTVIVTFNEVVDVAAVHRVTWGDRFYEAFITGLYNFGNIGLWYLENLIVLIILTALIFGAFELIYKMMQSKAKQASMKVQVVKNPAKRPPSFNTTERAEDKS